MKELIPINYGGGQATVSGRELHNRLSIETRYNDWFGRMCEYGFDEGKSYYSFLSNRSDGKAGKAPIDHALTISMAKEICMIQRSEVGRKFREYFIKCEESWNSPEKIMERALLIAHQRAIEAEQRIFGLTLEKETLEIALNDSLKFFTVAKYSKVYNKNWSLSKCQEIGKKLSAYCRGRSIEIKKCETNDERFGSVNSYPLTAWESFLKEDK
ncbi:antA/AntB antirepressor family protein [Lachnospiraceae bacterium ZAX-1]